jgi:2-keto-4-pentenoate hydratase
MTYCPWKGERATSTNRKRLSQLVGDAGPAPPGKNLDGPVFALRHLVELLAADPLTPPLAAGEIATTGTLTCAFPVAEGETWTTQLTGIPFEGARIRFV